MAKRRFTPWMILVIVVIVAAPLLIAMAASDIDVTQSMMFPNASLVAILLAVPAMYLLRGPFDQR